MARVLLILIISFTSYPLYANSCCGQSPASFTVLALDQKLSVNAAYTYTDSQGRVFNNDDFYIWSSRKRQVQSLQMNIASTVADKQQIFITSSFLNGQYKDGVESASAQHWSDTQVGYNYEVLSEYSYSLWRPIIYASLLANIPTGKSIYDDSSLSEGTDVTGHNQWGAGLGLTVRKVYFPLTITLQARSLRIFAKTFDGLRVSDFFDNSAAVLLNYATRFDNVSINLGLTTNQLSARTLSTGTTSGTMQNTTVLAGLQKPIGENWAVGLNYSDQTLLGPAKNTLLNRSLTFNLNYNYF